MSRQPKTAPRKAQLISADEVFAKVRRDPAYRAAYEALDDEFSLVNAIIKAWMPGSRKPRLPSE